MPRTTLRAGEIEKGEGEKGKRKGRDARWLADRAEAYVDEALQEDPPDADLRLRRGRSLVAMAGWAGARSVLGCGSRRSC